MRCLWHQQGFHPRGSGRRRAGGAESCCDPSGPQFEKIKVPKAHRNPAGHKGLNDFDSPFRGDAALAPFQTRRLLNIEGSGGFIDDLPSEAVFGHVAMIGQIVPACQDTVSQDAWTAPIYRPGMNEEARF